MCRFSDLEVLIVNCYLIITDNGSKRANVNNNFFIIFILFIACYYYLMSILLFNTRNIYLLFLGVDSNRLFRAFWVESHSILTARITLSIVGPL